MGTSKALRLDVGGGKFVAIATYEMIEVLTDGLTIDVPSAPAYCCECLEWKEELLPIFDLLWWHDEHASGVGRYLAVVAWQEAPGAPLLRGCLRLAGFPELLIVDDSQACAYPDATWRSVATSCFRDEQGIVPILSLARVFHLAQGAEGNAVSNEHESTGLGDRTVEKFLKQDF